jgi:hypothetical protein
MKGFSKGTTVVNKIAAGISLFPSSDKLGVMYMKKIDP